MTQPPATLAEAIAAAKDGRGDFAVLLDEFLDVSTSSLALPPGKA